MKLSSPKARVRAICTVRDVNGKIKVDHPEKFPKRIWDVLSTHDKEQLKNDYPTLKCVEE